MLIRNLSKVERFIKVHLEYDDGSIKTELLKKGSMGRLTFRYDDKLITEYGVVKDIAEGQQYRLNNRHKESVIIVFDVSHKFRSREYKIPLCDLIDIDITPSVNAIGPNRGKMSMKVVENKDRERGRHTWPISHHKNEKK